MDDLEVSHGSDRGRGGGIMASHIVYPIGVLTNKMMKKVTDALFEQEAIELWVALGDGGAIPDATPNPTSITSTQDVGKINNEYVRFEASKSLMQVSVADDTMLITAPWTCTTALGGKTLNEIGVYDSEKFGSLLFCGWPSTNKSRFSIATHTLIAGDLYTFYIEITPNAGVFA